MRLRHLVQVNPPQSEVAHLPGDTEVVFAPMEALADGLGGLDTSTIRPLDEVRGGSYSYFAEGDLLLAKVTPCFENGKKAIATNLPTRIGFATSEVHVVRVKSSALDKRYLNYVFCSDHFRFVGVSNMTGAGGLRRVPEDAILNYRLPISDLALQRRIADFLDCETARINRLIEKKRELVEKLEEKRSALSSHAVTRGLNSNVSLRHTDSPFVPLLPAHWTLPKLKQLAVVKTGITLGRKIPEGAKSVEVPYLRVANVQAGWLDLTEITTIAVLPHELEQFRLQKGDVLMNEGGDADKLGRGVIWDGQIDPCLHQNHVFAVRPREPELGEWIVLATNARHGRDYFYLNSKQSTNLASIAKSRVEQFPVPLPPKDERRAIVKHVNEKVERINRTQAKIQESIQRFRELRAALITAAVTGQIDPDTWRNRGETDRRMEAIEAEVNE